MKIPVLIFVLLACSTMVTGQINPIDPNASINLDDFDPATYGEGTSFGFHILGHGLAGLTARRRVFKEDQIGLTASFTPFIELDLFGDVNDSETGIMIGGEYNLHLGTGYKLKPKRTDKKRHRYKKHYLSLKGHLGFSSYIDIYTFGFTWHKEMFFLQNKNFSKGIDLGLMIVRQLDTNNPTHVLDDPGLRLYLRFDWNWFRG